MSTSPSGPHPRVAVVCLGDPHDPAEWSGTPHGIFEGLRECGAEAVGLSALPPVPITRRLRDVLALSRLRPGDLTRSGAFRTARSTAQRDPALGALATAVATRRVRSANVDAVIQIGSEYRVRHPRVVTFEDMTVQQAVEHRQEGWCEGEIPSRWIERRKKQQAQAYAAATAVATATPWAAASVVDDYGVPADKVHAVGLGPNRPVPEVAERRWDTPRFLFVGRDWERKNGDSVVRTFTRLRASRPEATLDIVGGHPRIDVPGVTAHGPLDLDREASQRLLADLFAASTCLVVPSKFEAAGIVFIEAAHAGLPCIGTTVGGAPDLIGGAGRVVDPADPEALLAAMSDLAEPDAAAALGAEARIRASGFTWPSVAARLLASVGLHERDVAPPWAVTA